MSLSACPYCHPKAPKKRNPDGGEEGTQKGTLIGSAEHMGEAE
jgi:hypothetical protein